MKDAQARRLSGTAPYYQWPDYSTLVRQELHNARTITDPLAQAKIMNVNEGPTWKDPAESPLIPRSVRREILRYRKTR